MVSPLVLDFKALSFQVYNTKNLEIQKNSRDATHRGMNVEQWKATHHVVTSHTATCCVAARNFFRLRSIECFQIGAGTRFDDIGTHPFTAECFAVV